MKPLIICIAITLIALNVSSQNNDLQNELTKAQIENQKAEAQHYKEMIKENDLKNNPFNTTVITSVITLLVAVIGGIIALLTNAASRRNDHRLSVLKVLLEAAYKEYEFRTKQDIELAKSENKIPNIKSFTEYIIFYKGMAKVFSKRRTKKDDIITCLEKNKELIDTYYDNREKHRPKYHRAVTADLVSTSNDRS